MTNNNPDTGTTNMSEKQKLRLILRRANPVRIGDPEYAKVDLDLSQTGYKPEDWEPVGFVYVDETEVADGVTAGNNNEKLLLHPWDTERIRADVLTIVNSVIVNKVQNESVQALIYKAFDRIWSDNILGTIRRVSDQPTQNVNLIRAEFGESDFQCYPRIDKSNI